MSSNDDYVTRAEQSNTIPVQSDDAPVAEMDTATANSDAELKRDQAAARNVDNIYHDGNPSSANISLNNIYQDRLRGEEPKKGAYTAPGDKEGLPENDGRSRIAQ